MYKAGKSVYRLYALCGKWNVLCFLGFVKMLKQNMAAICDALYTQFQEDCLVDVITVFRHLEKGSFLGDCFAMNVVGLTEMW